MCPRYAEAARGLRRSKARQQGSLARGGLAVARTEADHLTTSRPLSRPKAHRSASRRALGCCARGLAQGSRGSMASEGMDMFQHGTLEESTSGACAAEAAAAPSPGKSGGWGRTRACLWWFFRWSTSHCCSSTHVPKAQPRVALRSPDDASLLHVMQGWRRRRSWNLSRARA